MSSPYRHYRFVSDELALDSVLFRLKLIACPHCRQTGALIGHGFLRGYAERGSAVVVRGRRVFCSNRANRHGCGRTHSVSIATVLCGFVLRTLTLWTYVRAVFAGHSRRAAWLLATEGAFALTTGYRVWNHLVEAQSTLRPRLCRYQSAPLCASPEPLAQLIAHITGVIGGCSEVPTSDPLSALQMHLQLRLFEH